MLFLDLDGFKETNDSQGHAAGDAMLIEVASRLSGAVRAEDTVARLGGDEFAVLIRCLHDDEENNARAVADRIKSALSVPFSIDNQPAFIRASIGIAYADSGAEDAGQLLRNADLAMYRAKAAGEGGYVLYNPAMHAALVDKLQVAADMRIGLEQGQFELYYQAEVDMTAGDIIGFEALARWNHPERGLVAPNHFIPLAESTGLIRPLGQWVLEQACRQAAIWSQEMGRPIGMAVNVSSHQLGQPDFLAVVSNALADTGIEPSQLCLEMTESVLMNDTEDVLALLNQLKGIGVRLAIDDFGTGYSSLSYLHRFPFDTLKIDRSFVERVTSPSGEATLARTIVQLGQGLGVTTVAEGLENPAQYEALRRIGCNVGQGFYISRPVPAAQATQLLTAEMPVQLTGDVEPPAATEVTTRRSGSRRRGSMSIPAAAPVTPQLLPSYWPASLEPARLAAIRQETPFLVFDPNIVSSQLMRFRSALPGVDVHYAMKCNGDEAVLRRLHEQGAHFEIASVGELRRLLELGARAEDVLFSNPVKPPAAIAHAHAAGVWRFSFDTENELRKIAAAAPGAAVYLRLRVDDSDSVFPLSRKFGATPPEGLRLLLRARELGLRPYGVTFHVGSQCTRPATWGRAIEVASRLLERLAEHGIRLGMLNLGGGFPAHYGPAIPSIGSIGSAIEEALEEHLPYRPELIAAEPGRFLVAESAVLVATVLGRAVRDQQNWLYLDVGAYNGLMETLQTGQTWEFPLWTSCEDHALADSDTFTVTGPSCDSSDTMFNDVRLPASHRRGGPALHRLGGCLHPQLRLDLQRLSAAGRVPDRRSGCLSSTPDRQFPARRAGRLLRPLARLDDLHADRRRTIRVERGRPVQRGDAGRDRHLGAGHHVAVAPPDRRRAAQGWSAPSNCRCGC